MTRLCIWYFSDEYFPLGGFYNSTHSYVRKDLALQRFVVGYVTEVRYWALASWWGESKQKNLTLLLNKWKQCSIKWNFEGSEIIKALVLVLAMHPPVKYSRDAGNDTPGNNHVMLMFPSAVAFWLLGCLCNRRFGWLNKEGSKKMCTAAFSWKDFVWKI